MSLNNSNNSILSNDCLDNIIPYNINFPLFSISNRDSPGHLFSLNLNGLDNSESKNDFSIGHLTNKDINILNFNSLDNNNNNPDNFKSEEGSEKTSNLKNEDISNDSTIFTKGIYDNYSKQMISEAMNETNQQSKKVKSRRAKLFTQSPKKYRKKKKNILSRKENSDNIRKKIKSRFLKCLKNEINKKLEKAGSKCFFSYLPYSFVCNLSKKINKIVLDLTLKEIFEKNFCDGKKKRKADLKKYQHNLFVLDYLENNREISEKSNFNIIRNMKFSQIFKEYLESKEFGFEISTLKKDNENDKYIKDYIIKAKNFLNFLNQ